MTDKEAKMIKNARAMKAYCQRKYKDGCSGCILMDIIYCDSSTRAPKYWELHD